MLRKYFYLPALILLFGISGCSTYRTTAIFPEPRPLAEEYPGYRTPEIIEKSGEIAKSTVPVTKVLTLPEALSFALLNNPELAAFSYEIRAAEARALQASLYPNPGLDIELENFAGSGEVSGFQGTESTISLSQIFLLGGKRSKAVRAAALEGDLAAWNYESKRLDVFTAVRTAFLEVLSTQQRVALNEELVNLSEQLVKTISERIKAGKVSPAEGSRARVILSATKVELERARRELASARIRLAATWGSTTPTFERVAGRMDTLFTIPNLNRLQQKLPQNPDIARFATEMEQRQAVIALEDALRIPDPTVSGGLRRLNESDDNAFVVGLSIPLPLSDRNQGARQEARIRFAQTLREKHAIEVQLNAALSEAYNNLISNFNEATTLKERILPEAENAYRVIKEGYLQGRFDFLDVLDAQRTLFEARGQYLRTLTDFHRFVAKVERLIAMEINAVQ